MDMYGLIKTIITLPEILYFIFFVEDSKNDLRVLSQGLADRDFGSNPAVDAFYARCGFKLDSRKCLSPMSEAYTLYILENSQSLYDDEFLDRPYSFYIACTLLKPIISQEQVSAAKKLFSDEKLASVLA